MSSEPIALQIPTIATPPLSQAYRMYVLVALSVVGFMHNVDRVVINMFIEPIKKEFLLSDTEVGLMTGVAFAIMGGLVAVPIALYADRGSRKLVIGASFTIWTIMTAVSGMATSFVAMFAARLGVGIGEAGCVPASHSMLGDYYPRELRSRALAVHGASLALGGLCGMVGGGVLVQTVGWRSGFLILGVAGLVFALVFHLTVREPKREASARPRSTDRGRFLAELGDIRAFILMTAGGGLSSLMLAALVWMPSYFTRAFALTPIQIGIGLGLCGSLPYALGAVAGGQLSLRYVRKSRSWGARAMATVYMTMMPFYVSCYFAPIPALAFGLLFIGSFIAGMGHGPLFGTIQELVSPHARATAVAVVSIAGVVVGQGMGPFFIGVLSDWFQAHGAEGAGGLRLALTCMALPLAVASLIAWMLSRRIDAMSIERNGRTEVAQ